MGQHHPRLSHIGWDDYVQDGIEATRVVKEITGEKKMNAVAWCIGDDLGSTEDAEKARRKYCSATFLTTLRFSDPRYPGVS